MHLANKWVRSHGSRIRFIFPSPAIRNLLSPICLNGLNERLHDMACSCDFAVTFVTEGRSARDLTQAASSKKKVVSVNLCQRFTALVCQRVEHLLALGLLEHFFASSECSTVSLVYMPKSSTEAGEDCRCLCQLVHWTARLGGSNNQVLSG